MHIDLSFKDRHVLVFGGTTGINFGIAAAFARQGGRVTVVSRKAENVRLACDALSAFGGDAYGVCADVRDFEAVGAAFVDSVGRFGPVDVLVSGAAGNFLCAAKDMSPNGFRAVVDIDLIGTFNVLRQAYAHLRKPGASVINITAPQSWIPMRFQAHCGAAKAGVDQLTRVLALEWGGDGIRINGISPGPIEGTEDVRRLIAQTEERCRAVADSIPLRRTGTTDDIASLALFLSSDFASFISGTIIPCNGGGAIESVRPALESAGVTASSVGA